MKSVFVILVHFSTLACNGKSIGEVRDFEELKVQEFPIVADIFSM